jgi:hypothetical protein
VTEALNKLFDEIVAHWPAYLAALVALSGLTMSVIQVAKQLFFVRRWFHHARVLHWLDPQRSRLELWLSIVRGQAQPLEKDLLRITASGDAWALYDAELEDVCAQLSAAAQLLVDYPEVAPKLLKTIARSASARDLGRILQANARNTQDAQLRQIVFDARNRVRAITIRSVDMFKLTTGSIWQRGLQVVSFALSFLIALVAVGVTTKPVDGRPGAMLVMALAAGFLAPVARDLLAAVEQLRK